MNSSPHRKIYPFVGRFGIAVAMAVFVLAPSSVFAANQTWDGSDSNDWSTAANWVGNAVPGSTSANNTTDVATFNAAVANNQIVIDANRNIGGLTFNGSAGNYTIGSTVGNALHMSNATTILIGNGLATNNTTITINAPLLMYGGLTINNVAPNNTNKFVIGGSISSATSGAKLLVITSNGTNSSNVNEITGLISNGNGVVSVTQSTSGGLWRLLNDGNTFTGNLGVTGGSLSVSSIGNQGAASAAGAGTTINFGSTTSGGSLIYLGGAATTNRTINMAGTTGGGTIVQSGSGLLNFTSNLSATGVGSKTLALRGTGLGEISGAIVDNTTTGSTVATAASTSNTTLALASVDGLTVGNGISGTGIAGGTTISAIDAANKRVTLSAAATVAIGATITSSGLVNITSVTKSEAGTWTLSGNNTYTGATTVSGGTLQVGGLLGGGSYSGNISISNSNSGAFIYNGSNSQTLSGVISGAGAFTKNNTSTLTLSGNNTYSGATTVTAGTLQLGHANALGATTSGLVVNGTLDLNGNSITKSTLSGETGNITSLSAATLTFNRTNATIGTYNGTIGGDVALLITNSNNSGTSTVLTLGGSNTYTGNTTIYNSALAIRNGAALGNSTVIVQKGGQSTAAYGGELRISNNITVSNNMTLAGAGYGGYNGALRSTSGNNIVTGTITSSDTATRLKADAGTLTLNGDINLTAASAYTTLFVHNGGDIRLGGNITGSATQIGVIGGSSSYLITDRANAWGTTRSLTLGVGNQTQYGRVDLNGFDQTVTGISVTGTDATQNIITNRSGTLATLTINNSNSVSSNNTFSGNLAITKTGGAQATFSGISNNTGDVRILNGTVILGSLNALGSGNITVNNTSVAGSNATLQLNAPGTYTNNFTLEGAGSGNGALQTSPSGNYIISGQILMTNATTIATRTTAGNSSLTIRGGITTGGNNRTLTLNVLANATASYIGNSITFDTTSVNLGTGGTLDIGAGIQASGTGTVNLNVGGNTWGTTIVRGSATAATSTNATLNLGAANALGSSSAVLQLGSNSTALEGIIVNLNGHNQTIGGLRSFTGSGSASANGTRTVTSSPAATLTIDNSSATNYLYDGVISGNISLVKNGTGAQTLSGNNTYTGTTTINGGTLLATNLQSSGVTVNTGGTIGAGSAAGAVGTLTVGSLTLNGGSAYSWDVANANGSTAGTDWDLLSVAGALTLNASAGNKITIALNGAAAPSATKSFNIINYGSLANTWDSTAFDITNNIAGSSGTWSLTNNGTFIGLTYTASAISTWSGASGSWSSGFDTLPTNNAALVFAGAGGTATNDIPSSSLSSLTTITINSTAGPYTLAANSGSSGFDAATPLSITGITNNSANATTVNLALAVDSSSLAINAAAGNITMGGPIANNNAITFSGANSTTVNGAISGTGEITKAGNGTLILSGDNSYTGATTISAGALNIQNNNALGTTAGGTTVSATGAALQLQGDITVGAEALSLTGTGVSSSTGALRNISGNNTFGGPITIGGATQINSDAGLLTLSGGMSTSSQVTFGGAGSHLVSGNVSGSGSIRASAPSVSLTLSGTNTFNGNLVVDAGTVTISSIGNAGEASAAGAGSTISIGIPQGTGTLVYTGSAATSNKTIALSTGPGRSMTINQNGTGLLKFTSNVTSTGLGFRTLVLGGNGSGEMAGAIVDSASGTTMTTATAASGSTQLTLASVDGISANSTITGTGIANGTIITALNGNTANLSIATTASVNASSTVLTIPGVINPTGVTKNGTGTWTLSGANTYSGNTTISAGALNIQHANALGTTARGTTVASGAALQLQGDITVGAEALSLTGTGVSTTGALRSISGNNTYGGAITLAGATRINSDAGLLTLSGGIGGTQNLTIGGAGNTTISSAIATSTGTLTKDGDGTLILSGANTYTGNTTISAGTLTLAGALSGSNVTVSGASSVLNQTSTGGIAGSGTTFTLTSGNATLAGSNTYTGATTVNGGTLNLTGSNTGSATAINSGGTLIGTGNAGAVTVNSGGIIGAGNATGAVGTLTVGSLTINGGSGYTFTIGDVNGSAAGTDYDQISSAGALALNNTAANPFTIYLDGTPTGWSNSGNYTWNIISAASQTGFNSGNFALNFSSFGIDSSNRTGLWNFTNPSTGNISLTYTASAGDAIWSGGAGNWSTGFSSSPTTDTSITFDGSSGGVATNNIPSATLSAVNFITFNSTAGAYTLNATTGAAGLSGGTPLTVKGDIINNAASTQTINMDLALLGSSTGIINTASGNITIGGVISGAGDLTKTGTGTLTLSGNNTYTGQLTVAEGTLSVATLNNSSVSGVLGNSTNSVVLGSSGKNGTLSYTGGTLSVNKTFTMAAGGTGVFDIGASGQLSPGAISGTGALSKTGAGNLVLGSSNTYSGGTTLGGSGWVAVTVDSAGTAGSPTSGAFGTGMVTLAGAQLRSGASTSRTVANAITISADTTFATVADEKSLTFTGPVTLSGATRTLNVLTGTNNSSAVLTFSGAIGDGGNGYGITKNGGGQLTLSGNNTYSGGTIINAGRLNVSTTSGFGTGNVTIASGAFTGITHSGTMTNNITIAGSGTANGAIQSFGSNATLSGLVTLSADAMIATRTTAGSGNLNLTGGITSGGTNRTLTLNTWGNATQTNNQLTISTNSVNLGTGGTLDIGHGLQAGGAGIFNLNVGNNTWGTTIVRGSATAATSTNATLNLGVANALGSSSVLQLGNSTTSLEQITVNLNGNNQTIGGLRSFSGTGSASANGTRTVTSNTAATLTIDNSSATNYLYDGVISGGISLVKSGTATQTLTGNNTYTGTTTISAGNLSISTVSAVGSTSGINLANATSLIYTGSAATLDRAISVTAGTGTIRNNGGALTLTGGLSKNGTTLTFDSGTFNVDTIGISGSAANSDLVIDGATVNLNVANDYNGPTFIINGATLNANAAGALPTSTLTAVTINGSSTLALGASQSVASLTGAASSNVTLGSNTITIGNTSGNTTYAGRITGGSSSALVKDGASTQVLTGNNTGFTGTTTINSGTLQAASANSLGSNNTVQVNGGSLLVSAPGALNNMSVTLNSTSIDVAGLAFSGNYSGRVNNLTLSKNSIIDLGEGSVSIMFDTFVMSTFTLDIYNWTGTTLWNGGTGNDTDKVYFGPDLSDAALAKIYFHSGAVGGGDSFLGSGFELMPQTSFDGGLGYQIIPVPEPETYATGLLLLLGGAWWMWKRNRKSEACSHGTRLPCGGKGK
jgi:autotransporter-associated beta strand protein